MRRTESWQTNATGSDKFQESSCKLRPVRCQKLQQAGCRLRGKLQTFPRARNTGSAARHSAYRKLGKANPTVMQSYIGVVFEALFYQRACDTRMF